MRSLSTMAPRDIVIPLPCDPDHTARCRTTISGDTGWDVRVEIDDRVVSITHCSDWHRVERVCEQIKRIWPRDYAPPPKRA